MVKSKFLLLICTVISLSIWLTYSQTFDHTESSTRSKFRSIENVDHTKSPTRNKFSLFEMWHNCVIIKLEKYKNAEKFWADFRDLTNICDEEVDISELPIIPLRNKDETKYAILPLENAPKSPNILVTLGIGNDIEAELELWKTMNKSGNKIQFYGADPITDKNEKLYSEIGTYFPFAVGSHSGYSSASVLYNGKYIVKNVVYIELVYFIKEVLKLKTIDHLWFDAEYAEYEVFELFYKNGSFDKNNITFCQMSLEVHNPNIEQKGKFMNFIMRLIADKRFGFFNTVQGGHIRMWLFNFENQYCVNKFIASELMQ